MAVVIMGGDEKKPVFHDFLGMSCSEAPPQQAAVIENGGGIGGNVLLNLGSERRGVNNSEVFHFHGRKNASLGPETSYTVSGRKRSNTDSSYLCLAKDKMTPVGSDYHEYSINTKISGKQVVNEPLGRSSDFEMIFSIQPPRRPTSSTLNCPSSISSHTHYSKLDRSIPVNSGQMIRSTSRFCQSGTYMEKFGTSNAMLFSQAIAEEDSRTSIKSSGILNNINSICGNGNRNSADVFPSTSNCKAIQITEPAALNLPSHRRIAPAGRQMTIFYAGQAHVFDDVHPNKADVIMAMAGSSGGSWSTTYAPKSAVNESSTEARVTSSKETQENNKALYIQGNPVHFDEVARTVVTTEPLNLVPGGHSASRRDIRSTRSAELPDSRGRPDISINP